MDRADINELYYITPIANVPSILQNGILSNRLSAKLAHRSVAMPEIQARRTDKRIPGAGHLHDYANLYFDAHNPMLSKLRQHNNTICVLRIDVAVLDLPGIIVADRNASSDYARFYPSNQGLSAIDRDKVFARYWTHAGNQYEEWAHKSVKCSEILVPKRIEPKYILGAYVANEAALAAFDTLELVLTVTTKSDIFF